MIRMIKCDMSRVFPSISFLMAVLVTFLLCFMEDIYVDSSTMQTFSVLEALFRFDRTFMEGNVSFSALAVFKTAFSGYSAIFLPILASFPFVYSQSAERNSGNIRFLIFRARRRNYYLSKFVCAVLSGGMCIMTGVALFGSFVFFVFPHAADYASFYSCDNIFMEIVKKLCSSFLYGCANTISAFFLSSFCRNRYIVLCVPFLIRFMHDTVMKKITAGITEDAVYQAMFPFECYAPSQIPYLETGFTLYLTIVVTGIFMVLVLLGYIVVMEHRTDAGG